VVLFAYHLLLSRFLAHSKSRHLPEIVHILQIKESELKGLKDKIGHLAEQIAKLPGDITESLIEKLREYETQKRQIVEHIEKIRAEREEMSGKVIDLDIAHRFFRIFDARFQKRPALEQRGLIEEVVHSLIVGKNEVKAFYYVLGSPDSFSTILGSAEDEDISNPAQPWSQVSPRIRFGGAEGDRTLDLELAKLALYQLSYSPILF
jgi:hypothetical protein